ncbi:MAG: hypothetical protein AAF726_04480 [Planctomycetota bacterium]
MSWFQDDNVLEDERPRETVAGGVVLERRSLLRKPTARPTISVELPTPEETRSATGEFYLAHGSQDARLEMLVLMFDLEPCDAARRNFDASWA